MAHPGMLFAELTRFRTNPSPATAQIRTVISSLAEDACRSRRFTQGLCQLITRGRDICDQIGDLMDEFRQNRNPEVFQRYTQMIEDLEEHLFEAAFVTRAETHDTTEDEVVTQALIYCWSQDRDLLYDIMADLHSPKKFESTESTWEDEANIAFHHDDLVWLSALCESIQGLKPLEGEDVQECVQCLDRLVDLQSAVDRKPIQSFSKDDSPELVIQCAMRLYMMRDALINDGPTKTTHGLVSGDVWGRATSVLDDLLSYIRAPGNPESVGTIAEKWTKFELLLLLGYITKPRSRRAFRPALMLIDDKVFDVKIEGLDGESDVESEGQSDDGKGGETGEEEKQAETGEEAGKRGSRISQSAKRERKVSQTGSAGSRSGRAEDSITFAHVSPGYYLFQQRTAPQVLRIRHLGRLVPGNDPTIFIPSPIIAIAAHESSKQIAYVIISPERQYQLYLNKIPPIGTGSRHDLNMKVDHIFWIKSDTIGLIADDQGLKDVYECRITPGIRPHVDVKLLFTLKGTVQEKSRLNYSVIADGEWMAFNTRIDEKPRLQIWSKDSMGSHIIDGDCVGTLARVKLGDKPLTLLVVASRADEQDGPVSFVVYEIGHRPVKRPFELRKGTLEAQGLPGQPTFVHIFETYGVALVITSSGAAAGALLFDIHTGQVLQKMAEHVKWQGSFSHDSPESDGTISALLTLSPGGNVFRMRVDVEQLEGRRRKWVEQPVE